MIRKLLREFYLLPRGEQRALLLLSLLVIFSLGARIGFRMLPAREPPGMDQFREEALAVLAAQEPSDSLQKVSHSPYIKSLGNLKSSRHVSTQSLSIETVSINTADSADLLPLPGIGPVFAGRIIKYRNLLGGYFSIEQLSEVYGLSRETIERITPHIEVDTSALKKLDLNNATFRKLLRHPYLEYEDVKSIVSYRDVMGSVSSIRELKENLVLADSILDQIEHYIDCFQ